MQGLFKLGILGNDSDIRSIVEQSQDNQYLKDWLVSARPRQIGSGLRTAKGSGIIPHGDGMRKIVAANDGSGNINDIELIAGEISKLMPDLEVILIIQYLDYDDMDAWHIWYYPKGTTEDVSNGSIILKGQGGKPRYEAYSNNLPSLEYISKVFTENLEYVRIGSSKLDNRIWGVSFVESISQRYSSFEGFPDPLEYRGLKVNGLDRGETGIARAKRIELISIGKTLAVRMSKDSHGEARYGLFSDIGDVGYLPDHASEVVGRIAVEGLDINKVITVKVSSVTPVSKRKQGSKYALMTVDIDFTKEVKKLAERIEAEIMENETHGLADLNFGDMENMFFSLKMDGQVIYDSGFEEGMKLAIDYLKQFLSNPDEGRIRKWLEDTLSIVNSGESFLTLDISGGTFTMDNDTLFEFAKVFYPDTVAWEETARKMKMWDSYEAMRKESPSMGSKRDEYEKVNDEDEEFLTMTGVGATGKTLSLLDGLSIKLPYGSVYVKNDDGSYGFGRFSSVPKNYRDSVFAIEKDAPFMWSLSSFRLNSYAEYEDISRTEVVNRVEEFVKQAANSLIANEDTTSTDDERYKFDTEEQDDGLVFRIQYSQAQAGGKVGDIVISGNTIACLIEQKHRFMRLYISFYHVMVAVLDYPYVGVYTASMSCADDDKEAVFYKEVLPTLQTLALSMPESQKKSITKIPAAPSPPAAPPAPSTPATPATPAAPAAPPVRSAHDLQSDAAVKDALLERAFIFLEDGDFERADDYIERVLDVDPKNARAYIGKLCVELRLTEETLLAQHPESLANMLNYKKALRFADVGYLETVSGYEKTIQERKLKAEQAERERKQKEIEEQERLQWEKEEQERKLKEAHERIQKEKEERERIQKEKEEQERKQRLKEELERALKEEQAEQERIQKEKEKQYNDLLDRMTNAVSLFILKELAHEFRLMDGYKDTDVLADECEYRVIVAKGWAEGCGPRHKWMLGEVDLGGLRTFKVPDDVTGIGAFAFYEQGTLKDITLPECLIDIDAYAFYSCSSLRSLTIPSGVKRIGDLAFWNCESLKYVEILGSVVDFGADVFLGCNANLTISAPADSSAQSYAGSNKLKFEAR